MQHNFPTASQSHAILTSARRHVLQNYSVWVWPHALVTSLIEDALIEPERSIHVKSHKYVCIALHMPTQ